MQYYGSKLKLQNGLHIKLYAWSHFWRLGVSVKEISIKPTTTEGLGFVGREEGIAIHAVVTHMPA